MPTNSGQPEKRPAPSRVGNGVRRLAVARRTGGRTISRDIDASIILAVEAAKVSGTASDRHSGPSLK
ncbi:hypothetical protein Maq22A_c27120 [Methylobacterium aquaticum]|uniref:Uncharacterized protein n=1 Tax=Methylobacterium aquaticum TaxID=270351 RepID=A0A0C6FY73_9HYPH|nr:hypothetical protein Maq22A_c27120 [Methylobacterium aquaticum]